MKLIPYFGLVLLIVLPTLNTSFGLNQEAEKSFSPTRARLEEALVTAPSVASLEPEAPAREEEEPCSENRVYGMKRSVHLPSEMHRLLSIAAGSFLGCGRKTQLGVVEFLLSQDSKLITASVQEVLLERAIRRDHPAISSAVLEDIAFSARGWTTAKTHLGSRYLASGAWSGPLYYTIKTPIHFDPNSEVVNRAVSHLASGQGSINERARQVAQFIKDARFNR